MNLFRYQKGTLNTYLPIQAFVFVQDSVAVSRLGTRWKLISSNENFQKIHSIATYCKIFVRISHSFVLRSSLHGRIEAGACRGHCKGCSWYAKLISTLAELKRGAFIIPRHIQPFLEIGMTRFRCWELLFGWWDFVVPINFGIERKYTYDNEREKHKRFHFISEDFSGLMT